MARKTFRRIDDLLTHCSTTQISPRRIELKKTTECPNYCSYLDLYRYSHIRPKVLLIYMIKAPHQHPVSFYMQHCTLFFMCYICVHPPCNIPILFFTCDICLSLPCDTYTEPTYVYTTPTHTACVASLCAL